MQKLKLIDLLKHDRFNSQFIGIEKLLQFISSIDSNKFNDENSYITLLDNSNSNDGFEIKFTPKSDFNCGLSFDVAPIYDSLFIAFEDEKSVELMYAGADIQTSIDMIIQILQSPINLTIEVNNSNVIINKIYSIVNFNDHNTKYNLVKTSWFNKPKLYNTVFNYQPWV